MPLQEKIFLLKAFLMQYWGKMAAKQDNMPITACRVFSMLAKLVKISMAFPVLYMASTAISLDSRVIK